MPVFLRLELPWPPSGNRYWRHLPNRDKPVRSQAAREYIERIGRLVPRTPMAGRVVLGGCLHEPDRRKRDLGNHLKVLEDALEGLAYLDDCQVRHYARLGFSDEPSDNPRVELTLQGERWATAEEVAGKGRKLPPRVTAEDFERLDEVNAKVRATGREVEKLAKRLKLSPRAKPAYVPPRVVPAVDESRIERDGSGRPVAFYPTTRGLKR